MPTCPDTWAITSYFNPMRYRTRRENYRVFREHLGLPLATVELSLDGRFELSDGDADLMIYKRGRDILWHKERLLNLAVAALPESCRNIVWVDCDVVFDRRDWHEEAVELLDRFALVHPFTWAHHLPRGAHPRQRRHVAPLRKIPSVAAAVTWTGSVAKSVCTSRDANIASISPGFAWVARKQLLDRYGLYDACITGGGDSVFTGAAWGCFDRAIRNLFMNAFQKDHYLAWARPFFHSVARRVGWIEGDLYHLWHGDLAHRR